MTSSEPAFVPDYLTLNEAATHLERETGRPWSASALLGFCAQGNIPMHAAVPRDARAVQCEVTDPRTLTIRPVKMAPFTVKGQTIAHYRPATWRMAVAHPVTIAHVWQTGRGEVAHAVPTARDDDPGMVMFVNDRHEPIAHEVTAEDLRVSGDTLRAIRDRWGAPLSPHPETPAEPAPAPSAELVKLSAETRQVFAEYMRREREMFSCPPILPAVLPESRQPMPTPSAPAVARPEPVAKTLPRQRQQEAEVLRVLRELGHDPHALPRNTPGRAGPKAAAFGRLGWRKEKRGVFDKAWERLRQTGEIVDA
jgi:hypothetical protein